MSAAARPTSPLLSIAGLTVTFRTARGDVRAVDDVSFDVPRGRTVALVGESGSGKSVTALSILRLVPSPPGRIEARSIALDGRELIAATERDLQRVRGAQAAMVFQEPMTSLNPVYSVGAQIVEAIRLHQDVTRAAARARAIELLGLVGIPAPNERVDSYPHELSGGMRQRVMIAMALSCGPKLLIADEPTTALDVTIQAQVLELMKRLQNKLAMGILFITHDLGVVAEVAHAVVVMYAGQVVEQGPVDAVFARPLNPYTRGLLRSLPRIGTSLDPATRPRRLPTLEGMVPDLRNLPSGCRFHDRCELAIERCATEAPTLRPIGEEGRTTRCHRAEEL